MYQVPCVPYLACGCVLEGFVPGPERLGCGFSQVQLRNPALPSDLASEAASNL